MKNEIQRSLRAEYEGLSFQEQHARMQQEILEDPLFGRIYRQCLEKRDEEALHVAEDGTEYHTRKDLRACFVTPRVWKVFVDTSVFGGCFDEEFEKESRLFFDEVKTGRFQIVVSDTVMKEIKKAPEHIRSFVDALTGHFQVLVLNDEVASLRDAYIEAGILGKSSLEDAEHIATATLEKVDLLVSWNFKHIVHFDKIKAYNGVNALKGYGSIDIRSPQEVIAYDE